MLARFIASCLILCLVLAEESFAGSSELAHDAPAPNAIAGLKGSATFIPSIGGVPIGAAAITASANIDWEATARARVGYAEQNWLFYATGGLAILGTKG